MKHKIVCIVGMPGAGKTTVADEFVKNNFAYLRFGQIVIDKIKKLGLKVNEKNEKKIREDLRKRYGMGALAMLNIPKIDKLLKKFDVVVDGLYSWSEYKIMKERYGEKMYLVAVFAPPKLRYERLTKREAEKDKDVRFRSLQKKKQGLAISLRSKI
jgi:dephospho-CoA kinase